MDRAEFDKIKTTARTIVEQFGIESFLNPGKAKALMLDFLPKNNREIKIIVSALQENVGKIIAESMLSSNSDSKLIFQKCTNIITKNLWLEENAAKAIVIIIEYALTGKSSEILRHNTQPKNSSSLGTTSTSAKSHVSSTTGANTASSAAKSTANTYAQLAKQSASTATNAASSNNSNKYTLTNETITVYGHKLYRIKALKDFGNVKKGDKGGYVESYTNLAHGSNCWISDNATVYDNAKVYGDAQLYGEAQVSGNARVYDNAKVYGNAKICNNAKIYDMAQVYGGALVSGNAKVNENAVICSSAKVYDNSLVFGNAKVGGNAKVYGNARLKDENMWFGKRYEP
ncbi:MAG: hypothetical protein IJD28_02085 [Deferribacterales bacterium]|nr:hypothetical protein [Deferribacterales bacterium]